MDNKESVNQSQEAASRWQQIRIDQFGFVNNLFLAFSVGLFSFLFYFLNDVSKYNFSMGHIKCFFIVSILFNVISFLLGVVCSINRLIDFRITAKIALKRFRGASETKLECDRYVTSILGKVSWFLFFGQILNFLISATFILLLVFYHNSEKF